MNLFGKKKKKEGGSLECLKPALFLERPFVDASLVAGDIKRIVQLPLHMKEYEVEWIACNVFDFFNSINLLYSSIAEFCTPKECKVMSGGPGEANEYQWLGAVDKKPMKVSAPQYIDLMMTSIQNQLDDEMIFPTKADMEFNSKEFISSAKGIFRQFFRLFAHIYFNHYEKILHLEEEAHLNTLFLHFIVFAFEFDLIDRKETNSLDALIAQLLSNQT
jgi:MOB kinase activator 1